MRKLAQAIAFRFLSRQVTVPIARCVHFCGFRYGRDEFNPYEDFLRALTRGGSEAQARTDFIGFLRHYRPRHLGEALGLELERTYPLWHFPWTRRGPRAGPDGMAAWFAAPDDCPDLLTHFSARGISRRGLEEEFGWLEGALDSIRRHGFQPERFRSAIRAKQLVRSDGSTAWLLLDGNHRVASLAALGHKEVPLRYLPSRAVRETELARWPRVRRGVYTTDDARRVLRAYFVGNRAARTTSDPAPLVETFPEAVWP